MPRSCTICLHPERETIDRLLLANESYRSIAKRFAIGSGAVFRHAKHLPEGVGRSEPMLVGRPDDLLTHLRGLADEAKRLQGVAEASEAPGSMAAAVAALREQSRIVQIVLQIAEARADRERNGEAAKLNALPPRAALAKVDEVLEQLGEYRRRLMEELAHEAAMLPERTGT